MSPVEDHRFRIAGEHWLWRYSRLAGRAWGWTDYGARKVLVDATLTGRKRLEIELHEGLHAALGPTVAEETVTHAASDLARVLWSLGYRRA